MLVWMQKDFDRWNGQKAELNNAASILSFKEREIWFCHLGLNIGHEQDGDAETFLRPALILKKFPNETFFAIPLTRTPRFGKEYLVLSSSTNPDHRDYQKLRWSGKNLKEESHGRKGNDQISIWGFCGRRDV